MKDINIDDCTLYALECIFKARRGCAQDEILDTSVWLYLYVLNGKIYPAAIVQGFYSAMAVIFNLSDTQFIQISDVFKRREML